MPQAVVVLVSLQPLQRNKDQAHCLKITQNVALESVILAVSTNFCPIKTDPSGNTQASVFQKLAKMDHFWHF